MKGILEIWAEMKWYDRVTFAAGILCSLGIIVFGLMGILNIMPNADRVYIPLAAAAMLAQAFRERKKSRFLMIFSLVVGIFLAVLSILMFVVL